MQLHLQLEYVPRELTVTVAHVQESYQCKNN